MQGHDVNQVLDEVTESAPVLERPLPVAAKKRVQSRIQVEILKLCRPCPLRRTPIVYRTNLNFLVVRKYLNTLISCGFLLCEGKHYLTTEKGFIWAKKMDLLLLEVSE